MVSNIAEELKIKKGPSCYVKHSLPVLETPRNIRIKFSKTGSLQYISHLDLQRLFGRATVRAGIPLWYTQGFNPHPKMVFALPLPVGVQSVCEFLDVKIDREIGCDLMKELLNRVLTNELEILEVYEPSEKFASIHSAEYTIKIKTVGDGRELEKRINEFLHKDGIMMKKHTKSGEKDVDISTMIFEAETDCCEDDGSVIVKVRCAAGTESLNPEYIISALKLYNILPDASLLDENYSIIRERVLCADRSEFR